MGEGAHRGVVQPGLPVRRRWLFAGDPSLSPGLPPSSAAPCGNHTQAGGLRRRAGTWRHLLHSHLENFLGCRAVPGPPLRVPLLAASVGWCMHCTALHGSPEEVDDFLKGRPLPRLLCPAPLHEGDVVGQPLKAPCIHARQVLGLRHRRPAASQDKPWDLRGRAARAKAGQQVEEEGGYVRSTQLVAGASGA